MVVVNVSPLEYCHVLLVPTPEKCLPQMLTESGLKTAIDFSLVSGNRYLRFFNPQTLKICYTVHNTQVFVVCRRYFRVGFNSLGGFASVNHLHFHGYLLEHDMFLETTVSLLYCVLSVMLDFMK